MYPLIIAATFGLSIMLSLFVFPEKPAWFFGPFFGLVGFVPVFFLLSRKMSDKVRPFFEDAQRHMQARKVDEAIAALEGALAWRRWQLFLEPQINSEIGLLHYAAGNEARAAEFLRKGYLKQSTAHVVLGAILYREGKLDEAKAALEKGITYNKKSPILYNVLAWMLEEKGQRQAALEVLGRGAAADPADEGTTDNLTRLQNDKKMNMRTFGDLWFMLKFETPKGMGQQPVVRKGFRTPPKQPKGRRR